MKKLVAGLLVLVLLSCLSVVTFAEEAIEEAVVDLSAYGAFDLRTLFRRPRNHIGEKYVLQGSLGRIDFSERTSDGGYNGLWLEISPVPKEEHVLLWIDPLEFNLFEDDWVEVYLTITDVGPLSTYKGAPEVFYAHVEALTVFDGKDGEIIETYVQSANSVNANTGSDSGSTINGIEHAGVEYFVLEYENNERNPGIYVGKNVTFTGKVVQVFEQDGSTLYRVATSGTSDDIVLVLYTLPADAPRILGGDTVTVYGVSTGVQTYESASTRITVPACVAIDVVIND